MPNSIWKERRSRSRIPGKMNINPFDSFASNAKRFELSDFIVDTELLQIRAKMNQSQIRQYADDMKKGDVFPPLTLAKINDVLYLVDGFHRYEALRYLGITFCDATVQSVDSIHAARLLAIRLNSTHGLKLTREEKRNAVREYVKAGLYLYTEEQQEHYQEKANELEQECGNEYEKQKEEDHCTKSFRQMAQEIEVVSDKTVSSILKKEFPDIYNQIKANQMKHSETNVFAGYFDYSNAKSWKDHSEDVSALEAATDHLKQFALRFVSVKSETERQQLSNMVKELVSLTQGQQTIDATMNNLEKIRIETEDF